MFLYNYSSREIIETNDAFNPKAENTLNFSNKW